MSDLITQPKSDAAERYKNLRIKFDAKLLRVMAPFVAKNNLRYYLNGLRIERAADKENGIYLVGTNGHIMGIYYDPDGQIVGDDGRGVIMSLHPGLLTAAGKITTRFGAKPLKVLANGLRVSLAPDFGDEHTGNEIYVQPGMPWVDGNFPEWRRVLPEFETLKPVITGAYNGQYIATFAKILGESKFNGIRFWQPEHDHAKDYTPTMVVQVSAQPNFVGICMPIRDNPHKEGMRAVFDAKPKKGAGNG